MKNENYTGILFGPQSNSGLTCSVFVRGDSIEALVGSEVKTIISYSGIKISVMGMDDKYICMEGEGADGEHVRLLVSDKEIAAHMVAVGAPRAVTDQLGKVASTRARRKASRLSVMAVLAGILAAIIMLLRLGFGWAAGRIVEEVPPQWEVEIGRSAALDILEQHAICSDPAMNKAVQELGSRLVMGLGMTPYRWRIRIIDDEEVNAFALPGGYVFINRGLLERSDDGYQVAGVLAHEFQHVLHRHGIKNMVRQIGLMIIVYAVVGDAGEIESFLVGNAANLASMSFSRDQETEADLHGMELIYKAGLEPTGLMRFMEMLAKEEGLAGSIPTILSTHPASDDRAAELEALVRSRGQPVVRPLTADWSAVKGECVPVHIQDPDQP